MTEVIDVTPIANDPTQAPTVPDVPPVEGLPVPPVDAPLEIPPVTVAWPESKDLGLPAFNIEIPNKLGSGLLVVYRTPAVGDMGGYQYEAFYNQSEVEQRPGCEAEKMIELIRVRVSTAYGMGVNDHTAMTQVVEYKHPAIDYAFEVTGDISAPVGE